MKTLILLSILIALAMTGGIHRVAQSDWNVPNQGQCTSLNLYFSLDNPLPVGAYIKVTFPWDLDHVPTSCSHWEVSHDSLGTAPETPTGTMASVSGSYYCSFATALNAGTAYGLSLTSSTSTALQNDYAPIAL